MNSLLTNAFDGLVITKPKGSAFCISSNIENQILQPNLINIRGSLLVSSNIDNVKGGFKFDAKNGTTTINGTLIVDSIVADEIIYNKKQKKMNKPIIGVEYINAEQISPTEPNIITIENVNDNPLKFPTTKEIFNVFIQNNIYPEENACIDFYIINTAQNNVIISDEGLTCYGSCIIKKETSAHFKLRILSVKTDDCSYQLFRTG